MSDHVSETPWLEPVERDTSRWQEFIDDTAWRIRQFWTLIAGFAVTLGCIGGALYLGFTAQAWVVLAILGTLGILCCWAAQKQRGLLNPIRGVLYALCFVLASLFSVLLYGLLFGYTMTTSSGDEFYPQQPVEMTSLVAGVNIT